MLVKSALFTRKTHSRADEQAELLQRLSPESAYEGNSSGAASVPLWIDAYDNSTPNILWSEPRIFLDKFSPTLDTSHPDSEKKSEVDRRPQPARSTDGAEGPGSASHSAISPPNRARCLARHGWAFLFFFLLGCRGATPWLLSRRVNRPLRASLGATRQLSGCRELGVK